jgi:histidinol-phosphate aminotransferase
MTWTSDVMKNKESQGWLENKIAEFRAFDGSLLKYVESAGNIRKKTANLKASPSNILRLDSNENFFVTAEELTGLLKDIVKDLDLRVYSPEGVVELDEALGRYVGVPPECITVSSGSEQLIDLIVNLFLEKGDNVISIVPSFFAYEKRTELKKATFVGVLLNNDLSLNRKAILKKTTSNTRLIFICSPNNPTGNQFEWNDIEALADEVSGVVVLDEAYAEFADYSVATSAVKKRNIVVLRTFSKAFGLAGMRFGYSVAHPDLALPLSKIIPYTVSAVTAKFIVKLLNSIDIMERSVEMTRLERERLIEELRSIEGIMVFNSAANFVTFTPFKEADYIHGQLIRSGILVKNLGKLPVIGHSLRVTVGLRDMNDSFLKALSKTMKTLG